MSTSFDKQQLSGDLCSYKCFVGVGHSAGNDILASIHAPGLNKKTYMKREDAVLDIGNHLLPKHSQSFKTV